MGGYLHILQAPLGATTAIEHRPDVDVPFRSGIAAGAAHVQYWSLHSRRGKEDDENQRDASTTYRALLNSPYWY
jgi:hypothetical protein